jgi:non-heme chloroperoxidase
VPASPEAEARHAAEGALASIAGRHGFSFGAVSAMFEAVQRGGGRMAQFSHPEFGGFGQWMQGGMTMVGDMFDHALKDRVAALCAELAELDMAGYGRATLETTEVAVDLESAPGLGGVSAARGLPLQADPATEQPRGKAMPFITTTDQTQLYVKDWGSGPAVVFIHGWPLSADSWDDHAMAVANAGMRAIAYDRRGFGRSSQPWSGYDYDTLADDLAAVIEQTGAKDITLVGFSMGGGEIARYMSRHGGKGVVKAVLVSSVVPYMLKTADNPDGTDASVFETMTKGMKEDRAKFFASFLKDFYGVGLVSHPTSTEQVQLSWNVAMQASLKATLACAEAFGTTDFRPDIASFKCPTLVIHGTADKTVPIDAGGRAAAKAIANATLIEYEGAPHGVLATEKDRFTRDLLSFLQRPSTEGIK